MALQADIVASALLQVTENKESCSCFF